MKINKNSWHYRLVESVDVVSLYGRRDICSYTRAVIGTIFILFVDLMLFGMLLAILAKLFYESPVGTATALGVAILGFYLAFRIVRSVDDPKKEPGFVKQAYRSWKDKYCIRVEYVDKEET